jgi:hypothetical protein
VLVQITPFVGAGPIRFGMTLDQVGTRLPDLTLEANERYWSDQLHAFIDFDDDGGVEGIEFAVYDYEPPVLDDVALGGTLGDLAVALGKRGWACARGTGVSSDTLFVLKAGVTLWTEDPDEGVQAAGVWPRGRLSADPPEWGHPAGVE